jgi:hypothetical protein
VRARLSTPSQRCRSRKVMPKCLRVERRSGVDGIGQVTHHLIAEKVQGDSITVATGQRATEPIDIELCASSKF